MNWLTAIVTAGLLSSQAAMAQDVRTFQGQLCSQLTGMMFDVSLVDVPIFPGDGHIRANPAKLPDSLGLSRYYPGRLTSSTPAILHRDPEKSHVFSSEDHALQLTFRKNGYASFTLDRKNFYSALEETPTLDSAYYPILWSMMGYVPPTDAYLVNSNYKTSDPFDNWVRCDRVYDSAAKQVKFPISEVAKSSVYWSYDTPTPAEVSTQIWLTALTNNEGGVDEIYVKYFSDGETNGLRSRTQKMRRHGDQSGATETGVTKTEFWGCTYKHFCLVEVWEADNGPDSSIDADDLIGRVTLSSAQRGRATYWLNGDGADYVMEVSARGAENSSIYAVSSKLKGTGTTVFNFDTRHRDTLYALGAYTTITDTDKQNVIVRTHHNSFEIPYLKEKTWIAPDLVSDDVHAFQTHGFVFVFRSSAARDALAKKIDDIEMTKLWTSLTLQVLSTASTFGGPAASPLLAIVDDGVTNALTELTEEVLQDSPDAVVTTPASNPFVFVTASEFENYTSNFPFAVRALEYADRRFYMPINLYCKYIVHPIDYLCDPG